MHSPSKRTAMGTPLCSMAQARTDAACSGGNDVPSICAPSVRANTASSNLHQQPKSSTTISSVNSPSFSKGSSKSLSPSPSTPLQRSKNHSHQKESWSTKRMDDSSCTCNHWLLISPIMKIERQTFTPFRPDPCLSSPVPSSSWTLRLGAAPWSHRICLSWNPAAGLELVSSGAPHSVRAKKRSWRDSNRSNPPIPRGIEDSSLTAASLRRDGCSPRQTHIGAAIHPRWLDFRA